MPINGLDQWITLRGQDRRNPVILFLHGGPGLASSGSAPVFASWERDFTIVQWDQPGSGATFAKNIATDKGPYTQARYLADAIAVAGPGCSEDKKATATTTNTTTRKHA